MNLKCRSSVSSFLVLLTISALSFKLLLAMGGLLSRSGEMGRLLLVSEVMAKDQKKDAAPPAANSTADKPKTEMDLAKSHLSSPGGPAEMTSYLEQKEAELKRKEQRLQEQEQHLLQMQKETEQKLQELIAIQKDIQAYRNEKTESRNANIRSLAQIYGSMKPKEAAKLLENMEETLVVNVISTMKANEAADILCNMDPKRAAKISEALTKR